MRKFKWLVIPFTGCVVLSAMAFSKSNRLPVDNFEKNVIYGHNINNEGKDQQLGLDVYWPANAVKGKKYPLVVLVHGGSFINGRKEGLGKACQALADSGFVAATIDYRLGWNRGGGIVTCQTDLTDMKKATYRAFQDAHAALRYLVAHADKFYIDPNWVFIGGGSAGAVTALNTTYLRQEDADETIGKDVTKNMGGLDNSTNDLTTKVKIRGICSMWGGLPDTLLVNKKTAVPTIFFHGTKDIVIPFDSGHWGSKCDNFPALYGSAAIYRRVRDAGLPAQLNYIIGGKHGPDEYTHEQMMSNTACFFHHVMKGDARSGSWSDVVTGCR